MESEINTSTNSLEISDEIKSHIEEIFYYFSLDKSLEKYLTYYYTSYRIGKLKKIFKKNSLENLLEKLKKTCSDDIILILKAAVNLDISDELIKEINNKDSLNIALILAVQNGNEKNVELLLKNKVNEVNPGNFLIRKAIKSDNEGVLEIILETLKKEPLIQEIIKEIQDLDVNSPKFHDIVPLSLAIEENNKEIVERIIDFSKYLLQEIEPSNQVFKK